MASNEILDIDRLYKMEGEYAVRCPHCMDIFWLAETDIDEIRGSQYQHTGLSACGGWLEVDTTAAVDMA